MAKGSISSAKYQKSSLFVIGLGVGWLAGLSVSPVIATIITSIVGVTVALISTLSGLNPQITDSKDESTTKSLPRWNVNPVPLAFLIFGIVLGSIVGILARNHNWLGTDMQTEIQQWTDLGIPKKDVVQQMFERHYAQDTSEARNTTSPATYISPTQTTLRGDRTIQSLTNMGIEYEKQGKIKGAMSVYLEAITLSAAPMNYLAWLYQKQGDFDNALPLAQMAVMLEPDEADFIDTLAVVLCKTGQMQDAVRWMQQAANLQPATYQKKLEVFQTGTCQ